MKNKYKTDKYSIGKNKLTSNVTPCAKAVPCE